MTSRALGILRWLPACLWMGAIFWMSSLPGGAGGRFSTLAHMVEFAILAALLLWPLWERGPYLAGALTVLAASVYGALDEVHQFFVPGRVADPVDWLFDTLGAIAAAAVLVALCASRAKRTGRTPEDGSPGARAR